MNTGETGFLARVSISERRRALRSPKTPEEFQSPSVEREISERRRALSIPCFGIWKTRGILHESCYFRRFRRATGSDFFSAPRLRGRDPRRAFAAAADTSHSRPFRRPRKMVISPRKQGSRFFWFKVLTGARRSSRIAPDETDPPQGNETMTATTKTMTVRCKAFGSEGVRDNRIQIDASGAVRVWDSVAGHYTSCHSLSAATVRRLRRAAK